MQPVRLPDRPLKCLHLGDSYTIGEGVTLEEGWPFQLHELLQEQGATIARAHILAQTGWTTTDLLQTLSEAKLEPEWDFITLCIGVNNQYQGLDMTTFKKDIENLVGQSLSLRGASDSVVLMLSIPDWGISPFAIDRDADAIATAIDTYNNDFERAASSENIPFVNWTNLTRKFAGKEEAFAEDGLHPATTQYSAWASLLSKSLIPAHPEGGAG
ncbi:MAG: SGNH/GDSL hydrolase family protein [Puniceicoccaceae bacterium]